MESQLLFDDLFKRTYPKLFFYARGIVGNDEDAEDVVEEVFVDLWNRRNEVDLGEKIESYLFRATFTRAINVLHKAHRSEEQLSLLTAINDRRTAFLESEIGDPLRDVEGSDLRQAINEALSTLPEKSRRVFLMSYVEGLRHQEIADSLNISIRTVESHIYTALHILRKQLAKARYLLKICL